MAQKEKYDVFTIQDDGLDAIAKNALTEVFGAEVARDIIENPEDEELDEELQEIVDGAPALYVSDEI